MKILGDKPILPGSGNQSAKSRGQMTQIVEKLSAETPFSSFYVADLDLVLQRIYLWNRHMPNVKPIFPLKYNADPKLMKLLSMEGFGFGVSSTKEIEKLVHLNLMSDEVIMTSPCRLNSQLKSASANNVELITFDSENELTKIAKFHPRAKLLIRLATKDKAEWGSNAHGANKSDWLNLIATAADLGLELVGVAFDGLRHGKEYFDLLSECNKLFEEAKKYNFSMNRIDIGTVEEDEHETFSAKAESIQIALEHFFPHSNLIVRAYLSKFIAEPAYSLITQVTSAVITPGVNGTRVYSINDGIYESFNLNRKVSLPEKISGKSTEANPSQSRSVIAGSSGDELDLLIKEGFLPQMQVGDILAWYDMGNISTNTPIIYHQATTDILKRIRTKSFSEVHKCQEIEVEC